MPSVIMIEISDAPKSIEISMTATFTETIPMIVDEERAEVIMAQDIITEEGTYNVRDLVSSYVRAEARYLPNAKDLEDLDVLITFSEQQRDWKYKYVMRIPLRIYSHFY